MIKDPILKRFVSKIDVRGDDECWNWKGSIASNGYGVFIQVKREKLIQEQS